MSWRSQANFSSSLALTARAVLPSLYAQCAAMPSSAILCISSVRIWISMRSPSGPMTVVWSDWYMLGLGMAMKSLNRPGTGFHSWWISPSAS